MAVDYKGSAAKVTWVKEKWMKRPINLSIWLGFGVALLILSLLSLNDEFLVPASIAEPEGKREFYPGMLVRPNFDAAKYGLFWIDLVFLLMLGVAAKNSSKSAFKRDFGKATIWHRFGQNTLRAMGATGAFIMGISVTIWALVLPNANSAGIADLEARVSVSQAEYEDAVFPVMATLSDQVIHLNQLAGQLFASGLVLLLGVPLALLASISLERRQAAVEQDTGLKRTA